MCGALRCRVAGLSHVSLDESCVRCGAVCDDSFHQIWSCPVINAIPHDNILKSQHPFQRMVPAGWMEVLAAWDVVEPRVKHDSCDTLEEWARSNCLIMFFGGTGARSPATPCFSDVGGEVAPWSSAEEVFSLAPSKLSRDR